MNTLKKVLLFPVWLLAKIYMVFLWIVFALAPIGFVIGIIDWIRGE